MQYPILIVDDEAPIRAGLWRMITEHFGNQFILCEAENGFDALHILQNDPIRIVITDVKMPGMSGIELIEKARAAHLAAKFIVISGFDDYALVRAAMKAGALDYLLKPISIADVVSQLGGVKKSLEAELTTAEAPHISTYQQQLWVEALMQGGSEERRNALREAGIPPQYCCGLCVIAAENKQYSEKHAYEQRLRALADQYMQQEAAGGITISGFVERGYVFWSFAEDPVKQQSFSAFHSALTRERYFHSAQHRYVTQSDLTELVEACIRDLERSFYDLPRREDQPLCGDAETDVSAIVLEHLKAPDAETLVHRVNDVFYQLNDSNMAIVAIKKSLCEGFYQLMNRDHAFIPIMGRYKLTGYDMIEAIQSAVHLSTLRIQFLEILNAYLAEYWAMYEQKEDATIRMVKAFIDQNFSTNVQLADIAEHVHLHPNYLSTIFKEKAGVSFRDYLREVRVQKAKYLLDHSVLRIYEIALEVGYTEPAHFNRAFKTVVGVSPQVWKSIGDSPGERS